MIRRRGREDSDFIEKVRVGVGWVSQHDVADESSQTQQSAYSDTITAYLVLSISKAASIQMPDSMELSNVKPSDVTFHEELFQSEHSLIYRVTIRGTTCVMKLVWLFLMIDPLLVSVV